MFNRLNNFQTYLKSTILPFSFDIRSNTSDKPPTLTVPLIVTATTADRKNMLCKVSVQTTVLSPPYKNNINSVTSLQFIWRKLHGFIKPSNIINKNMFSCYVCYIQVQSFL